jgi:hypothetical protein
VLFSSEENELDCVDRREDGPESVTYVSDPFNQWRSGSLPVEVADTDVGPEFIAGRWQGANSVP